MTAYLTRDSVCAGDDGDAPHARQLELPAGCTVGQLIDLVAAAPLPSISGGRATWALASVVPLAVVAQQWGRPKAMGSIPPKWAELDVRGDVVRLHFSYFEQQDPDVVFAVLRWLRVRAE